MLLAVVLTSPMLEGESCSCAPRPLAVLGNSAVCASTWRIGACRRITFTGSPLARLASHW